MRTDFVFHVKAVVFVVLVMSLSGRSVGASGMSSATAPLLRVSLNDARDVLTVQSSRSHHRFVSGAADINAVSVEVIPETGLDETTVTVKEIAVLADHKLTVGIGGLTDDSNGLIIVTINGSAVENGDSLSREYSVFPIDAKTLGAFEIGIDANEIISAGDVDPSVKIELVRGEHFYSVRPEDVGIEVDGLAGVLKVSGVRIINRELILQLSGVVPENGTVRFNINLDSNHYGPERYAEALIDITQRGIPNKLDMLLSIISSLIEATKNETAESDSE